MATDTRGADGDTPEYTPRRRLEGTLTSIENRKNAVRELLSANQKAGRDTINYLQGYYDALDLASSEVRQAKDAEIMGLTPSEDE